jgi:hypothetical protein
MCYPPRVKFCWECGRKLWGNKHVHMMQDLEDRILHKSCAKEINMLIDHKKYSCTECGGDALLGFSKWEKADTKGWIIGPKERLCSACARKRGVSYYPIRVLKENTRGVGTTWNPQK